MTSQPQCPSLIWSLSHTSYYSLGQPFGFWPGLWFYKAQAAQSQAKARAFRPSWSWHITSCEWLCDIPPFFTRSMLFNLVNWTHELCVYGHIKVPTDVSCHQKDGVRWTCVVEIVSPNHDYWPLSKSGSQALPLTCCQSRPYGIVVVGPILESFKEHVDMWNLKVLLNMKRIKRERRECRRLRSNCREARQDWDNGMSQT